MARIAKPLQQCNAGSNLWRFLFPSSTGGEEYITLVQFGNGRAGAALAESKRLDRDATPSGTLRKVALLDLETFIARHLLKCQSNAALEECI